MASSICSSNSLDQLIPEVYAKGLRFTIIPRKLAIAAHVEFIPDQPQEKKEKRKMLRNEEIN